MKEVVEQHKKYAVHLVCGDCSELLNSIEATTGEDLYRRWTGIVTSSGFVAGKCPNDCRATYSDLNINTKLLIWDVVKGEYLPDNNWRFWNKD